MGRKVVQATPYAEEGKRLRAARFALGYRVLEHYAKKAGINSSLYSMHETGSRLITLERARALKREFGLSLEFIFDGNPNGLPDDLSTKIKEILPQL
jgi:transcriptional regulator with XRE-family HTH domain